MPQKPTDDLTITESSILGLIEDAERSYSTIYETDIGPQAVKAQLALVAVTGYQALAVERLANILSGAAQSISKLEVGFADGTKASKALITAIEDIRKVISSNGFDHGPR